MSPAAEEVALEALQRGVVQTTRADFQPGEARSLAIDVLESDAVVLVVRLRRDRAWITDVVHVVAMDDEWHTTGSSGGTYGDLPLEYDPAAPPEVVTLTTGVSAVDDRTVAYAGGFLAGSVDEVELVTSIAERRVPVGINEYAFVVIAPAIEPPEAGLRFDRWEGPRVRALVGGAVVDDTLEWDRDQGAIIASTMTVSQALAAPPGAVVTIRGIELQLEGQPALICDEIDTDAEPPRPIGAAVQLPGSSRPPSWKPDSLGLSAVSIVATGVIRDGVLIPSATNGDASSLERLHDE